MTVLIGTVSGNVALVYFIRVYFRLTVAIYAMITRNSDCLVTSSLKRMFDVVRSTEVRKVSRTRILY